MSIAALDSRQLGSTSSLRNRPPSLLMATTVPATLKGFLLPFAAHFRRMGWRVDALARDVSQSPECVAAFHRCHDIAWSRNPLDPRKSLRSEEERAGDRRRRSLRPGPRPYSGCGLCHAPGPAEPATGSAAPRRLHRPRLSLLSRRVLPKNLVFRTLERAAGPWTDALVVMNREDHEAARDLDLVPGGRVRFMPGIGLVTGQYRPQAIPTEAVMRLRAELELPAGAEPFLMVAELIPRKRHDDVLHALARLSTSKAYCCWRDRARWRRR